MSLSTPRVVAVRKGRVQPGGSWLYVWIDAHTGSIAHVGATGFDPELRAYLHVASADPQLGRVRAEVPRYEERDFDVLAFALPGDVDRSAAKEALVALLAQDGEYGDTVDGVNEMQDVVDPMVQALEAHRISQRGRPAT